MNTVNEIMSINDTWKNLSAKQKNITQASLDSLFRSDDQRFQTFSLDAAGLMLDYSKNYIDRGIMSLLFDLAERCNFSSQVESLFSGERINNTENRPALHTALRNGGEGLDSTTSDSVALTFEKMASFIEAIHSGAWTGHTGKAITDVVNIGIGGSDLGPVMVCRALDPYDKHKLTMHFVSNIDPEHLSQQLETVNPETTLFIVSSKSFGTIETRLNAESARAWCIDNGISEKDIAKHFVAVTSNIKAAVEFGIDEKNLFPMWDWVGGRYSLWSAIGLPIALSVGMENFNLLREGARTMDEHYRSAPLEENMPAILGLISVWNSNFMKSNVQVVIPYDHSLHKFPSFLQQLEMESNGKSVTRDGSPVFCNTKGAIFGESGSNTQHSFHQLLHQGTFTFPVDFIVPVNSHHPIGKQHDYLYANCLSQSHALMCGRDLQQVKMEMKQAGLDDDYIDKVAPHRVMPGNKTSNTIAMELVTPKTLGALIALYEHKVFTESVIWNINPFDQWGVELGKTISEQVYSAMNDDSINMENSSTMGLIDYFTKHKT